MISSTNDASSLNASSSSSLLSVRIQPDWNSSIGGGGNAVKFWVNVTTSENSKFYGNLKFDFSKKELVKEDLPDKLTIQNVIGSKSLVLKWNNEKEFKFISPSTFFSDVNNKKTINSIDISPGGQLGITGGNDGLVRVWDATNGTVRRDLIGHVGDVYHVRFLPSGKVAMSAGADFQIKIWDLSDGTCGASLKGHKGGITCFDFINRGRNFISTSRDGTCKLWDCATQSEITTLCSVSSHLTSCSVASNATLSKNVPALDEKEFDTDGKIGLCVSDNGVFRVFDIRTRENIISRAVDGSLTCCTFIEDGNIALVGSATGQLFTYDLRKSEEELESKQTVPYPIQSISRNGKWFTTADGGCFLNNYSNNSSIELTGPDCDPLYGVATTVDGKKIYTAGRDGVVRQYILQ
ncbi:hypothetical protein ABK040_002177 [Willaertia magna]